jgi:Zn finger protein HypA/HybF involved in hydrogenase expression
MMIALPEQPTIWLCEDCRVRVPDQDVLRAEHPFIKGEVLFACPHCREIEPLNRAWLVDGVY